MAAGLCGDPCCRESVAVGPSTTPLCSYSLVRVTMRCHPSCHSFCAAAVRTSASSPRKYVRKSCCSHRCTKTCSSNGLPFERIKWHNNGSTAAARAATSALIGGAKDAMRIAASCLGFRTHVAIHPLRTVLKDSTDRVVAQGSSLPSPKSACVGSPLSLPSPSLNPLHRAVNADVTAFPGSFSLCGRSRDILDAATPEELTSARHQQASRPWSQPQCVTSSANTHLCRAGHLTKTCFV